jgi:hypothetical protein
MYYICTRHTGDLIKLKVFGAAKLRSRGRRRTAGWWSCSSGDVGFRSAGSSRWNGAIASARDRSLFRNVSACLFSFLFILAGVGALSVGRSLGVVLLLQLADVPDKGIGVGIVHIAMGKFPLTPDVFRIYRRNLETVAMGRLNGGARRW